MYSRDTGRGNSREGKGGAPRAAAPLRPNTRAAEPPPRPC